MKDGIQSLLKSIGDEGCLVLCLIKIAENYIGKTIDPLAVIPLFLSRGWVRGNMFVEKPWEIMLELTGEKWVYIHSPTPAAGEGVYNIERWEWSTPKAIYNHFKLPGWDSCVPSPVVQNGKIVSYRIVRKEA